MKVLVVGNGFDLAHGLPTKYSHFIGVIRSIRNMRGAYPKKLTYKDLFGELKVHSAESAFFKKTEKMFSTDFLGFDSSEISKFEDKIRNNIWLDYFVGIRSIETWIDFEEEVLTALNKTILFIREIEFTETFAQLSTRTE